MSEPKDSPKIQAPSICSKNAIFSTADEMALTVFRTIYSGVLKDNMDYSTRFADADSGMHLRDIFVFKPLYHDGMRASPRNSPPWRSPTRPCASPGS